jgi:hypothetical protein
MSAVDGRRDQPPPPPSDGRSKPPPLPSAARPKTSAPPPLPASHAASSSAPAAASDLSVDIEVPIPVDSGADVTSIDRLLALTESEWDPDSQALTLKRIAEANPKKPPPPSQRKIPAVAIPTPYELAPTLLQRAQSPAHAAPPPSSIAQSPSKAPPPLPPRTSKGPPPLPPQTSASSPPPVATRAESASVRAAPDVARRDPLASQASQGELVELLLVRIQVLEAAGDRVGLARAHLEMAIAADMLLGDDARVLSHAEAAVRADGHLAAAHSLLRRKKHGRTNLGAMLGHLEREIAAVRDEGGAVALLVERARLLDAMGEKPDRIRHAWEQTLSRAPQHPTALKGLEIELYAEAARADGDKRTEAYDALATHLARMADAYEMSPAFASWIHVERAQILELRLGRLDAARGAIERARSLYTARGAVR